MFYSSYTLLALLFLIFRLKVEIITFDKCLIKKKKNVVPKLRQEVKVKVDIVSSDDIKIYYTGKFQDFTARYIIKLFFILNSAEHEISKLDKSNLINLMEKLSTCGDFHCFCLSNQSFKFNLLYSLRINWALKFEHSSMDSSFISTGPGPKLSANALSSVFIERPLPVMEYHT